MPKIVYTNQNQPLDLQIHAYQTSKYITHLFLISLTHPDYLRSFTRCTVKALDSGHHCFLEKGVRYREVSTIKRFKI